MMQECVQMKRLAAQKALEYLERSKSLNSLIKLFEEQQKDHQSIPQVLNILKSVEQNIPTVSNKKFPLIVIEGLDGSGKSTVGMKLAKKIGAERIATPPKSMSSLRERFDGHLYFHAPFYYAGNYIAAAEIIKILEEKPVVMDRFWHSTTAFAMAQLRETYSDVIENEKFPDEKIDAYVWPDDLLKPDAVIFLDVSESVRNERLSRRTNITEQEELLKCKKEFRNRVVKNYENMMNPGVQKVDADGTFKSVLMEIDQKIKHLFP